MLKIDDKQVIFQEVAVDQIALALEALGKIRYFQLEKDQQSSLREVTDKLEEFKTQIETDLYGAWFCQDPQSELSDLEFSSTRD